MKSKRRLFQMVTVGTLSVALVAGLAQASEPPIRVSSCKGAVLETGERSLLIISPAGAEYMASSGNPEAVAVEQVLTYWVTVAKAEGTAEITVTGRTVPVTVTHLEPFGAFVDAGCGVSSLICVERISISRIPHPSQRFQVGDEIYAVVLEQDRANRRLRLTHRELLGTWSENAQS